MQKAIVFLSYLSFSITGIAQNVGIGTNNPAASAQLEISSTTRGVLLPKMTTAQKNAISNPIEGLEVYDLTLHQKSYYNGTVWVSLNTPATTAAFLPTIVIGTQQWMSKNLDLAFYRNGDPIPQVTNQAAWATLTTGAWCYYNNDSTQATTYGKLYNWYAVNDPRGLAPIGWHIPSNAELAVLSTTLGGDAIAGGKMKDAGIINWTTPNTGGNNNSGFTGLPAGHRNDVGSFTSNFSFGYWWSTTETSASIALICYLAYYVSDLNMSFGSKRNGFSVRCIRD
ncbi:MAG: fibrobacter succinogenes major paralogous domain-containing protein [Chitinophagaceae bacterium]